MEVELVYVSLVMLLVLEEVKQAADEPVAPVLWRCQCHQVATVVRVYGRNVSTTIISKSVCVCVSLSSVSVRQRVVSIGPASCAPALLIMRVTAVSF